MTHTAFKYIKAAQFFPAYAPEVKNWKHKLRGVDGNGQPVKFSFNDCQLILWGISKLQYDFNF